jgi:predicted lysophospholipase L1 biosynthesis ABC-type transport system permease subunit
VLLFVLLRVVIDEFLHVVLDASGGAVVERGFAHALGVHAGDRVTIGKRG